MLTVRNGLPAMILCLFVLVPQTTLALTEQQQRMLDQLNQQDNLDFLDSDANANSCIQNRDFTCAEKQIAKASRLARTQQDKELIQLTQQNLAMEMSLLEAERQARRDLKEAQEAAEIAEERAIRAQQRAQEEADENQRLKQAAMSAAFVLGGGGELAPDTQSRVLQAIATDSYGSGTSNFTNAINDIKAQQQVELQQQTQMLAEQRELQERQALARDAARAHAASREKTLAPKSSVVETSKPEPEIVSYVTQTVVIPDWSTPCPSGFKPAQENGRNITAGSGGAYCLKDSTSSDQSAGLTSDEGAQQSVNHQAGEQSNSQAAEQAEQQIANKKAEQEKQKAELAERKRQEEVELENSLLDALAFCWQSDKGYWFCDGPGDETTLGEKSQDDQLSGVGCKNPSPVINGLVTLTSVRVANRGNKTGVLYSCGKKLKPGDTGNMTWNRDIRRFWSGMPNSVL